MMVFEAYYDSCGKITEIRCENRPVRFKVYYDAYGNIKELWNESFETPIIFEAAYNSDGKIEKLVSDFSFNLSHSVTFQIIYDSTGRICRLISTDFDSPVTFKVTTYLFDVTGNSREIPSNKIEKIFTDDNWDYQKFLAGIEWEDRG